MLISSETQQFNPEATAQQLWELCTEISASLGQFADPDEREAEIESAVRAGFISRDIEPDFGDAPVLLGARVINKLCVYGNPANEAAISLDDSVGGVLDILSQFRYADDSYKQLPGVISYLTGQEPDQTEVTNLCAQINGLVACLLPNTY